MSYTCAEITADEPALRGLRDHGAQHQRAQDRRAAHPVPRAHRLADQGAEPDAVPAPAAAGDRAGPPRQSPAGADLPGRGQVQGDQRHLRPHGRRPLPRDAHRPAAQHPPGLLGDRPAGRRRVRRDPRQPGPGPQPAGRSGGDHAPPPGDDHRAAALPGAPAVHQHQRRHRPVPDRRQQRDRPDPQRRCGPVPRQAPGRRRARGVPRGHERRGRRAPDAEEPAAQGLREERAARALPAQGGPAGRVDRRRRGARALGTDRPGHRAARPSSSRSPRRAT